MLDTGSKTVEEGANVILNCEAVGKPLVEITWLKNFLPVIDSGDRIVIAESGMLHLHTLVVYMKYYEHASSY